VRDPDAPLGEDQLHIPQAQAEHVIQPHGMADDLSHLLSNWWTPLSKLRGSEERCLMSKTRREFTPEFKRGAVALLQSSGRPLIQIAAELGIQPSMLCWRNLRSLRP
jgi:hypothetical protein